MARKKSKAEKAKTKRIAAEKRKETAAVKKEETAAKTAVVDDGLVAFQCPSNTGNIGIGREHGSKSYTPDENGVVRVEPRDAAMMQQSGFALIKG